MSTSKPIEERFWAKVNKTESCWLWTGFLDKDGYGFIRQGGAKGKMVRAHRFSWELTNGKIEEGMKVLHNCPGGDNPSCVNPNHLFLGTQQDNIADMVIKGRHVGNSKLSAIEVEEIRLLYSSGCSTQAQLGAMFGVDGSHIGQIVRGGRWKKLRKER